MGKQSNDKPDYLIRLMVIAIGMKVIVKNEWLAVILWIVAMLLVIFEFVWDRK